MTIPGPFAIDPSVNQAGGPGADAGNTTTARYRCNNLQIILQG